MRMGKATVPKPGGFGLPLRVEQVDARNWKLLEPLIYERKGDWFVLRFTAPEGASTDFASVPRIFWWFIAPTGNHARAAVIHDHLYRTGAVPRFLADAIFRDAMAASGVGFWKRWIMWAGVRLGGRNAYQSASKKGEP